MNVKDARVPWIIGTALLVVAIFGIAWVFLITPKIDDRDAIQEQTEALVAQNNILELRVAKLAAQFAKMDVYIEQIEGLRVHIPATEEIQQYHDVLSAQLAEAGLGIERVFFNSTSSFDTAPLPKSRQASAETPAEDEGTDAEGETETGSTAAPVEVVTEVEVPEGLVLIPVELTFAGSYESVVAFLQAQQTNERIFSVGTVDMKAVLKDVEDAKPGNLSLIQGDVEVFLSGYLWALAPMASETGKPAEGEAPALDDLPSPGAPSNPFAPITGGGVGSSSGLRPGTPASSPTEGE